MKKLVLRHLSDLMTHDQWISHEKYIQFDIQHAPRTLENIEKCKRNISKFFSEFPKIIISLFQKYPEKKYESTFEDFGVYETEVKEEIISEFDTDDIVNDPSGNFYI